MGRKGQIVETKAGQFGHVYNPRKKVDAIKVTKRNSGGSWLFFDPTTNELERIKRELTFNSQANEKLHAIKNYIRYKTGKATTADKKILQIINEELWPGVELIE